MPRPYRGGSANGCYGVHKQLANHLVIITLQSRYLGTGLITAYQTEQPSNTIAIPKRQQTEIYTSGLFRRRVR